LAQTVFILHGKQARSAAFRVLKNA